MVSTSLQPKHWLQMSTLLSWQLRALSALLKQEGQGGNLLPAPPRASLTLNVPLSKAQLAQELAQDTGLADIRQLTGEQWGRSLSEAATNFCLSHLACVSGLHPAPEAQGPFAS